MATLLIEDFKIGLDRRRMNETSLPGSLLLCENAHITRGGEVEKSEAFIRFVDLPENTYGLKAVKDGFMVFGSASITPTLLNSNPPVRYQRLNDTGGVNSGSYFTITGAVAADTFTQINVAATNLLAGTSTCPATPANWPEQIVSEINANSGVSGYKAVLDTTITGKIILYASAVGTAADGSAITFAKTGSVTATSGGNFNGGTAATNPSMVRVLSTDLYNGKPYVIAEYSDGIIRHWYDGARVTDFHSGKARAKFTISSAAGAGAVAATGSFYIAASEEDCAITSILVDAVQLLASTVTFSEDVEDFPRAVADAINENSNASGFTAVVQAGQRILLTAAIPGTGPNGDVVAVATTGDITINQINNMSGGTAAAKITDITVNSVSIFDASVDVDWSESDAETALAVVAAINNFTATSGYEAFSYGAEVIIRKTTDGVAVNGHAVVITVTAGVTATPASTTMGGGSHIPTIIEPGRFVKTMKKKVYVLSGATMYYSAVDLPTQFASGTGSGFDNLSTNSSGAEQLLGLANYFDNLAIISRDTVLIWFVSEDPDQNQQLQVLNNIGTIAPNSITEFGDNDVFFLARSGERSLRARDTTNAAFVNDVGIAIDDIIQDAILADSAAAERSVGILEPRQGRLLQALNGIIYAYSFFPASKISAWSTYRPGFDVEAMDYQGQNVLCRSRNAIYKIGSPVGRVYDSRYTTIITPFLSGSDPSLIKDFTGIDIACQGTWEIYAAVDPLQVDEDGFPLDESFEIIGTVTGTSYGESGGENGHVPFEAATSHVSLKLVNRTAEYARIGNICLHYGDGGEKD
jgi:hypothetical protein